MFWELRELALLLGDPHVLVHSVPWKWQHSTIYKLEPQAPSRAAKAQTTSLSLSCHCRPDFSRNPASCIQRPWVPGCLIGVFKQYVQNTRLSCAHLLQPLPASPQPPHLGHGATFHLDSEMLQGSSLSFRHPVGRPIRLHLQVNPRCHAPPSWPPEPESLLVAVHPSSPLLHTSPSR